MSAADGRTFGGDRRRAVASPLGGIGTGPLLADNTELTGHAAFSPTAEILRISCLIGSHGGESRSFWLGGSRLASEPGGESEHWWQIYFCVVPATTDIWFRRFLAKLRGLVFGLRPERDSPDCNLGSIWNSV